MILREAGRHEHGALEVLTGFGLAADARGPAGRLKIKQAEAAIRSGLVELRIEFPRGFEFGGTSCTLMRRL